MTTTSTTAAPGPDLGPGGPSGETAPTPTEADVAYADTSPEQHDPASSPESEYLGAPIQTVPDDADAANPITYVATADELPPFQIAHGDADCNVPFQQSEILADPIEAAGGEATLTILPGATHADPQFDATQVEPAIAFLDETFGRS